MFARIQAHFCFPTAAHNKANVNAVLAQLALTRLEYAQVPQFTYDKRKRIVTASLTAYRTEAIIRASTQVQRLIDAVEKLKFGGYCVLDVIEG